DRKAYPGVHPRLPGKTSAPGVHGVDHRPGTRGGAGVKFLSHTFPNGLQVIGEQNPHALSCAIGAFVRTGSRDETPEQAGVSHFLEHMAFKGSDRRSAEDVNREFDEIGAKYNAYTTEEHTVYHAAVLPEYTPQALDLVIDLLRPSLR